MAGEKNAKELARDSARKSNPGESVHGDDASESLVGIGISASGAGVNAVAPADGVGGDLSRACVRPIFARRIRAILRALREDRDLRDGLDKYRIDVRGSSGLQIGDSNSQVLHFHYRDAAEHDLVEARELFHRSLLHREEFVGGFLKQALRQANTTFRISIVFMMLGGVIVLIAGAMALVNSAEGGGHRIALVSGLGGAIVSACGGAFSLKSDRARKHLARQAELMHSQLLSERRFVQVAELLTGIKDDNLNDRARVSLAIQIMGGDATMSDTGLEEKSD